MGEGLGFVPFHYIGFDVLVCELAGCAAHLRSEFICCKFHVAFLKKSRQGRL